MRLPMTILTNDDQAIFDRNQFGIDYGAESKDFEAMLARENERKFNRENLAAMLIPLPRERA